MSTQNTQRPIRVLLADNHVMFRQSLAGLLQADGDVEVVGDASNGDEAIALAAKLKPDMVIMEVDSEIEQAQKELDRMLELNPRPKVVILSMFHESRFVQRMLDLGPCTYLHKSSQADELLDVVRSAALDSESADNIVSVPGEVIEQVQNVAAPGLSAREFEILLWAARGSSNRQIAHRLSIAEATVQRHLANVYTKLGVASRQQAVSKGLSEGWILERDITSGEGV